MTHDETQVPDELRKRIQRTAQQMERLRANPYIPGEPTPKQWAFILDERREVLFGGAAGPGKSWALLASALLYVDDPHYRALLLRRTYQDLILPGALMDLADQWLNPTDAKRKQQGREWHFPSGAKLTFGYLANDTQKFRYQSSAFSLIGFDEASQFPESTYTYMFSRVRRTNKQNEDGTPLRMRLASNPGGLGHEWLKSRFINPQDSDTAKDRLFIPARMTDNPHLDTEAYRGMLSELDPVTRAQLEHGDWHMQPSGNFFLPTIKPVAEHASRGRWDRGVQRCRAWDLAATETGDWAVGLLLARDRKVRLWRIEDVVRVRAEPAELERVLTATAQRDGPMLSQVIEQEQGSAGKMALRDLRTRIFQGSPVYAVPTTGNKLARARLAASIVAAGDMEMAPAEWNHKLIDELIGFPDGAHDDQCLVAGTLVTTDKGLRAIEQVRPGDQVLTRSGYRVVESAGQTGWAGKLYRATLSNGRQVVGTGNHPVLTAKGWVTMAQLTRGIMVACLSPENQTDPQSSTSSGMDADIAAIPRPSVAAPGSTFSAAPIGECGTYTGMSGSTLTDPFPTASRFTTEMMTRQTTSSATLHWSPLRSIERFTATPGSTRNACESIWQRFVRRLRSGIVRRRVGPGTGNTGNGLGITETVAQSYASDAGSCSGPSSRPEREPVLMLAGRPFVAPVAVYNLAVEGEHEYVAGGTVVHNCDALAHAVHWIVKQGGADAPRSSVTISQDEAAAKPKRTQVARLRIVR